MQDLFSARVGTLTLLGIEWQLPDFLALHGEAQVALNERLNQQCEEVQREQRLDPSLVLQENGAISCTVLICSKRFSIIGWRLCASRA